MKEGALIINGFDLFTRAGAYVTAGGYRDVAAIAPLIKPRTVDWFEEHGEEVDLREPALEHKTVKLSLATRSGWAGYDRLLKHITSPYHKTYLDVNMASIGRKRELRYLRSEIQQYTGSGHPFLFTLEFRDEKPDPDIVLDFAVHFSKYPRGGFPTLEQSAIDGFLFTGFGARVLEASTLRQYGTAKQHLLRTAQYIGSYDTHKLNPWVQYKTPYHTHLKSYDASIKVMFQAPNTKEFWRKRDDFVRLLVQSGFRKISVGGTDYKGYYTSSRVSNFTVLPSDGSVYARMDFQFTIARG